MIADGWSLPAVADYIQGDCGEYCDVGRDSLVTMLSRFRKRGMPALKLVSTPGFEAAAREAVERSCEDVNVLVELDSLYRGEIERLERIHETEIMTGTLNPAATRLVGVVADLLMSMHQVRLDLGLHRPEQKKRPTIDPALEDEISPEAYKALCDPVSRMKVLLLVQDLRKRARQMTEEEQKRAVAGGEVTGDNTVLGEKLTAGGANRTAPAPDGPGGKS